MTEKQFGLGCLRARRPSSGLIHIPHLTARTEQPRRAARSSPSHVLPDKLEKLSRLKVKICGGSSIHAVCAEIRCSVVQRLAAEVWGIPVRDAAGTEDKAVPGKPQPSAHEIAWFPDADELPQSLRGSDRAIPMEMDQAARLKDHLGFTNQRVSMSWAMHCLSALITLPGDYQVRGLSLSR